MSAHRTVTVQTSDHGRLTIPEPVWCRSSHSVRTARADIHHEGAEHAATVDVAGFGPVRFLTAFLSQYPFAEFSDRGVWVAVEIEGEHHEFDPAGLDGLAAAIAAHVRTGLMPLRHRLAALLEVAE
ncbi:DUF6907 domain-containing protein [Streptomyces sp. NPDC002467]|uniref:DUF6907 domain-containing protein n=1 Tax=Streptomyces sp. NPDC002467 TaxID=3364647 RepID=UPI0036B8585C